MLDVPRLIRGGVDVNYHTLSDFRGKYPEWLKDQVVHNIAAIRTEEAKEKYKAAAQQKHSYATIDFFTTSERDVAASRGA